MIGSHDTFTYLNSSNPLFNLCKRWWKCQCKTVKQQYDFGVRFFDFRVRHKGNHWVACHGIADLDNFYVAKLDSLCWYMGLYPEAIYRIVLERGNYTDESIFIDETRGLCNNYPNLWRVDIKAHKNWLGEIGNNNTYLYHKGYKFAKGYTWETPSYELTGHITKKNFYKVNLKKEARKINSQLSFFKDEDKLRQMINSKEELYLLDFCTNEY